MHRTDIVVTYLRNNLYEEIEEEEEDALKEEREDSIQI